MKSLLERAPQFLFFTGKGGVGKTSMASSVGVGLADGGKRVLLISTDPASNLDEVLNTELAAVPRSVSGVAGLDAMNINPLEAAEAYRRKMIDPYRGVLPDSAIEQMEEQLSGACTVEIAGFNEFSRFIGDERVYGEYDHVLLDTAPTGHTLRLLKLPAAWNDFIAGNATGSSCLGPVSGLAEQRSLFEKVVMSLKDEQQTLLVLVARAEKLSLEEAARASGELEGLGLKRQHLIINGFFQSNADDRVAQAFSWQSRSMVERLPEVLGKLPQTIVPFRANGVMGVEAMRDVSMGKEEGVEDYEDVVAGEFVELGEEWEPFVDGLAASGNGVIMTMGKGGVGKTTTAVLLAKALASKGKSVHLSTTDPAAHLDEMIGADFSGEVEVSRIDPVRETEKYVEGILSEKRGKLPEDEFAVLEEELRSPCIEEIAVFQAFAKTVAGGTDRFIVLDTAPTGHTLLLLDASQAYHREVSKTNDGNVNAVAELLPRVKNPEFTKVVIVALPEATPVHEAEALQEDLRRAGIEPYGWVLNRSFGATGSSELQLRKKGALELKYLKEVEDGLARHLTVFPWVGVENTDPEECSAEVVRLLSARS